MVKKNAVQEEIYENLGIGTSNLSFRMVKKNAVQDASSTRVEEVNC